MEEILTLERPTPLLKREIHLQVKDLFKSLGKAIANSATQNWSAVSTDMIDAAAAFGLGQSSGEIGWVLLQRALSRALLELVSEQSSHLNALAELSDEDLEILIQPLGDHNPEISRDFFNNPAGLPLLTQLRKSLADWLQVQGMSPASAVNTSSRFDSYFVDALHTEWRSHPEQYAALQEDFIENTPFSTARRREFAWISYSAFLQKQIESPLFDESFGLKQVYVSLRGYWEGDQEQDISRHSERKRGGERSPVRHVVELQGVLIDWLKQLDSSDALRVISGGPGSGKSSFTRMLAAELSKDLQRNTLFVPLHHLDLGSDLENTLDQFARKHPALMLDGGLFEVNNLQKKPLILIFDGLDELSSQGRSGAELAGYFITQLESLLSRFNQNGIPRIQVVLTGREVVVQSNEVRFRRSGTVLHVLPYFLREDLASQYDDPQELLKRDQRDQWWRMYGAISGRNHAALPEELRVESLEEITAQPLLNYLVALSHARGKLDFQLQPNLNQVYADLLKSVWERGWETKQHAALQGMESKDFQRVLHEIAVAAWHGGSAGQGRSTTVAEIERHCESSQLSRLLEVFQEGAKRGVTRLLTAFYFRQSGDRRDGEKAFEFTHKSFGEYLTACRLCSLIADIHDEYSRHCENPGRGWSAKDALKQWTNLCGPTAMDNYLYEFLCGEIALQSRSDVADWQRTLCHLVDYLLRGGMPMELCGIPNYHEQRRQASNSEEALLAALGACAQHTRIVSKISWPEGSSLAAWLNSIQSQPGLIFGSLTNFGALQCIDASGQILAYKNLAWASLYGANLNDALMYRANLTGAILLGATLKNASLEGANLMYANLARADLSGARLMEADLRYSNMAETILKDAVLDGAIISKTNHEWALSQGARMAGVIIVEDRSDDTVDADDLDH